MLARYGSLSIFLLLVMGAAWIAAGFDAGAWYYDQAVKPAWTPPVWLFAITSAVTWLMLALSGWQLWLSGHYERISKLFWWALLVALAVTWSALFFGLHRPGWAWLELGFAIVIGLMCLRAFRPLSAQAASLLAPFLLWIGFLWVWNLAVWTLSGGLFNRVLLG